MRSASHLAAAIPLVPDGDEARRWAERELTDPVYEAAEPNFFDRMARAVFEFFENLFNAEVDGQWGLLLALIALGILIVIVVAAIVVWGLPRSTRRIRAATGSLFGDDDERSAAELRRAAAAHAARDEWDSAIIVRFRALARGLAERGIVETPPGATVHAFARAAASAFPAHADALETAAAAFDDVRYLRRPGTPDLYARVASVDDAVAAARASAPSERAEVFA